MNAPDPSAAGRTPFDDAAESYDAFESLPGTPRLRRITRRLFLETFPPGAHLLELNCGTGTDATALALEGMRVLATDASPAMLRIARRRADAAGAGEAVAVRELPFDRIGELTPLRFDGVYSNMGGLNCTGDLRGIFAALHPLLVPGACAVVVVMPDFSLWETASFAARGRFREAFRRRRAGGVEARVAGGTVHTVYHSPSSVLTAAAPWFAPVRVLGLNVFSPPPASAGAARMLGGLRTMLERLDDTVASVPVVARMGDHVAVVLRRIP